MFQMDKFVRHYLRILDIDPSGYCIRLRNISHDHSIDLSNIVIRQFHKNSQIKEDLSYTFENQIRPFLRSGEVVTIYSKGSDQLTFNIEPYMFIAQNIRQWLTDDHIQTELSINKIVFHSYRFYPYSSSDIPTLLLNRSVDSKQCRTKSMSYANRYARFIFPYCLSNNDIVNPHTSATSDQNEKHVQHNTCYYKTQFVKLFDSYPRRLTTPSQRIQSATITQRMSSRERIRNCRSSLIPKE